MKPTATALVIGCGYLGRRVARFWTSTGREVFALTRSRGEELRQDGLFPISGDVLSPGTLHQLPKVDTVLYAVGLDRSAGRSFREVYLDGLAHVLSALPQPGKFIYISSTSVYGQSSGEIVDEASPTDPEEENGRIVREAEILLRSRLPESVILRFAGIYGPGRIISRAALEKGEPLRGDAEKWLNLIHVEDGVRAIHAAEERADPGSTWCIADDHPTRRRAFYEFVAQALHAPPAKFEPLPEGTPLPSHERPNRRVSNLRMRAVLRAELRYPTFREGIPASIAPESSGGG